MSDPKPASGSMRKVSILASVLIALLILATSVQILLTSKKSINKKGQDLHLDVPEPTHPDFTKSETVSEMTTSIRTTLIKHWPLSIAISLFLLVGIIAAIVLSLVLEPEEVLVAEEDDPEKVLNPEGEDPEKLSSPEEEDPEKNVDIDEQMEVENDGSSLKRILGMILLVTAVIGMIVVVVESARAAKSTKGNNGNPTKPSDSVEENKVSPSNQNPAVNNKTVPNPLGFPYGQPQVNPPTPGPSTFFQNPFNFNFNNGNGGGAPLMPPPPCM